LLVVFSLYRLLSTAIQHLIIIIIIVLLYLYLLSGHTAAQLSSHDPIDPPLRVPFIRATPFDDPSAEELISYKNRLALLDISWRHS